MPGGSDGKESACNAGDSGSIPGSGRPPGGGNGYPLQYSCLENSMDKEPGQLQSMRSLRLGHYWAANTKQLVSLWGGLEKEWGGRWPWGPLPSPKFQRWREWTLRTLSEIHLKVGTFGITKRLPTSNPWLLSCFLPMKWFYSENGLQGRFQRPQSGNLMSYPRLSWSL